ncbi:FCD domain-containing protein [Arthrobacter sp. MYb213]|uniref:FadR/GntR family transcriptional regulator n=1 Tax=Arthrobacter sp. MYb213 TaxID=1848595 RepID=UPI0015E38189|nr:FCD domain-containing protein [Arthrobacter sp. MYb213]
MSQLPRSPAKPRAFEAIVSHVETRVLSGELKVGDRLPGERELVTQFQVGRSTVREAMRVLESNGLIASRPGDPRGALVLSPSPAPLGKLITHLTHTSASSLVDLLIYRMTLESSANSLAAIRRSDADLVQLERTITLMGTARPQGQAAFSRADLDFHEVVAKASGHTLLHISAAAVRQSIEQLIARTIEESSDDEALMARTIEHHQKVFNAIRDRDAHLAEHLARSSLFEYYAHLVPADQRDALAALASFGSPDSV